MATLVLGALGAAVGGSIGGSVIGLSGAVIGRAVGSALGRAIDQRVLGGGSEVVEHGRLDRLRLSTAAEGVAIPRVYGRTRVPGQVIWTTPFEEAVKTSGGGGKGGPSQPEVKEYSYSVSLAIALCEGEILRVGRVWADGQELALDEIPMRVYEGDDAQLPDPLIEAVEGVDEAPAYRGTAYVVMEDLQLAAFGNRVPQFTFEVVRQADAPGEVPAPNALVRGVALIPGTGEFALSTDRVAYQSGFVDASNANVNSPAEVPDFTASLRSLREEAPNLKSVALVVSWFGDDLRCGQCKIKPKVEKHNVVSKPIEWGVSGTLRLDADVLPQIDGNAIYGGTPSDASVIQAIQALNEGGEDVTYYPFILMDQMEGSGLPDPYGAAEQAPLPWRGRITTSVAPGRVGSPDGTPTAEAEVAAFFGSAVAEDFQLDEFGGQAFVFQGLRVPYGEPPTPIVNYLGAEDWGFRRYVLHQAALCQAAGGVEAFCIGTEMVALTQIRGANDSFPAVEALRDLAAEVRKLLPDAKIGYAADWSEYFGYHPQDGSGDVFFHLDPLWSDDEIDFVGIDNYMPLSDWRDGREHADATTGVIAEYDLGYLRANIEGGEGYDWYYPSPEAREFQRRIPIEDGAYGEPWVYRYKDLTGWWNNRHHNRKGGVRAASSTGWRAGMKPIRFTEYGCAAIDKGTNQPNKFLDPKSSESALPYFSRGVRDDAMQMQYIRALLTYWNSAARNPTSAVYGGRMLDMDHSLLWAWDTRPWPAFPNNDHIWSDAENYPFGHWWSGRSGSQPLANVIAEMCEKAGLGDYDVSQVFGVVRGYAIREVQSVRSDLQPLMLAHGVEASEQDGKLVFYMRSDVQSSEVRSNELVRVDDEPTLSETRSPKAELVGRVRIHHQDADGRFEARVGEAALPDMSVAPSSDSELPLALTRAEGVAIAERFLVEAQLSRDTVRFALPPSRRDVNPGDTLTLEGLSGLWRVDRLEEAGARSVEASRTDASVFVPSRAVSDTTNRTQFSASAPIAPFVLDLPILNGFQNVQSPYVGAYAEPWQSPVSILMSEEDAGYEFNTLLGSSATVGSTETTLDSAASGLVDRGAPLRVRFGNGKLSSARESAFLSGENLLAVGSGQPDDWELIQFKTATPVSPGVWDLSDRLRGQRGTEVSMKPVLPEGSMAVVVDGSLQQMKTSLEEVGLEKNMRIGPSRFALDHNSFQHRAFTPKGVGLRPYAPVHLKHRAVGSIDQFSWVRRTRIGGDGWDTEAPIGEAREAYVVRAKVNGEEVWRDETLEAEFEIAEAVREQAGFGAAYAFQVAQISDEYGPGAWASLTVE